jgi:regulatory protein
LATVSYLFGVPRDLEDTEAESLVEAESLAEAALLAEAEAEAAALAEDAARAALQAAAVAAAQALDAARAEAAAAVRAAEQLPSERSRTVPRLRAVAPDSGSGWYVDPLSAVEPEPEPGPDAVSDAGFESGRRPVREPESQPAGAVAAARAFLSTVESQTSATAQSAQETARAAAKTAGVRFVAEHDESDDEPGTDSADGTGRRKPPPVRQASINALARKGMSSAEMTDLLEAREVDPDEVVLEVQRLEAAGLLDDRVLAEHLVRTLQERKGLGRSAINAELRRRKVDQSAIDEALDTVDVDDELERCLEVAVKRASQLRSCDRATAERRLSAFLMRRGYAGSVISAAVAQALGPVGPRFR